MSGFNIEASARSLFSEMGIDGQTQKLLSGSSTSSGAWTTTSVEGLAELERNLNALPPNIARRVLVDAARTAGKSVASVASMFAPYDEKAHLHSGKRGGGDKRWWKSGHLRDLIKVSVSIRAEGALGSTVRAKVGLDKTHAFYGRYLEKGWTGRHGDKHSPRPFMLRAWEMSQRLVADVFETRLRSGLEREARRLRAA